MPEVELIDIKINPAVLQVDSIHSPEAGGQNVNKTESTVRISHILSGIVVSSKLKEIKLLILVFLFFYVNHKDDFISCEFFPFSISKKSNNIFYTKFKY